MKLPWRRGSKGVAGPRLVERQAALRALSGRYLQVWAETRGALTPFQERFVGRVTVDIDQPDWIYISGYGEPLAINVMNIRRVLDEEGNVLLGPW